MVKKSFSWTDPSSRPIIVAHRGLSAAAPENTLAAFALAIEEGADAIEFDLRLTADGVLAVIHDATLNRTTNGRGKVREMRYGDIHKLSAGAWFDPRFAAERVPTLDEVFTLAHHRIGINIEIKEPPRHTQYDIVGKILNVAKKHHALQNILITSFYHEYIKRAKQLEPRVATGVLHHPVKNFRTRAAALAGKVRADYFICSKSALRKRMVRSAHDHGVLTGVYTVNQMKTLRRVTATGIDMIFTDDPFLIRSGLTPIFSGRRGESIAAGQGGRSFR